MGMNSVVLKKPSRTRRHILDIDTEAYEGEVQLEIRPFESFKQINRCTSYLSRMKDINVVSESWSEDEGFFITISADAPLTLGRLLREMPGVADLGYNGCKKGMQKLVVMMEMAGDVPALQPA